MVRFDLRLRCGGHATSTASTCSGARRDRLVMSKRVREEVALRIAEVGAVEPHVGLVEDPVEGHEVPPPFGRRVEVEPRAVDQGVVAVGERGEVAPMAGHIDHRPVVVVVVEPDRAAPSLVVGNIGAPLSRQIHDGEV